MSRLKPSIADAKSSIWTSPSRASVMLSLDTARPPPRLVSYGYAGRSRKLRLNTPPASGVSLCSATCAVSRVYQATRSA